MHRGTMRLPDTDKLLSMWGEYVNGHIDGVKGFPETPYAPPTPSSTANKEIPFEPVLIEIDGIMAHLKQQDKKRRKKDDPDNHLYRIGWLWYAEGQPVGTIARLCRCSVVTVYNRLYRLRGIVKSKMSKY